MPECLFLVTAAIAVMNAATLTASDAMLKTKDATFMISVSLLPFDYTYIMTQKGENCKGKMKRQRGENALEIILAIAHFLW